MEDYRKTITINGSAEGIFHALTKAIPLWWTEMFEGCAFREEGVFTVRFGERIFKTIKVKDISNHSKIVWSVEDSLIGIPALKNQTEWIGTTILWEINTKPDFTEVELTHVGLHQSIECYTICSLGWRQFTDSLKLFVETGEGNPFINQKK